MRQKINSNTAGKEWNRDVANFNGAEFEAMAFTRPNPWEGKNAPLQTAWDRSAKQLERLSRAIKREGLLCLGVAGSYARMEAGPASDLDLVVVVEEKLPAEKLILIDERLRRSVAELGFKSPRTHGIFAQPLREEELFAPPIGQIDESPRTFGLRIQWLLEMQPLHNAPEFRRIQQRILERYAADFVTLERDKQWIYLLNDMIRYFRSLFLKYQWESRDNPARWELRNLKGRHSRTILYAGLLFLLGESGGRGNQKVGWLREQLRLTPLERIAAVYLEHGDPDIEIVLQRYGDFVLWVGEAESRTRLGTERKAGSSGEYRTWKENADLLQDELIRFVLDRRKDWSKRFFQRLFF